MRQWVVSMDFLTKTVESSSEFERCNTEQKKQYLIDNIQKISNIMLNCDNCSWSFWTWYPFYALWTNFEWNLPIIQEQLRYNKELQNLLDQSSSQIWCCFSDLQCKNMKDLKTKCKQCQKIEDGLKPRKIINRLPDIDMWAVRKDNKIEENKEMLRQKFACEHMYPSDIDPIRTMQEIQEIVWDLKKWEEVEKFLPLDIHMIGYDTLKALIHKVPEVIKENINIDTQVPYLPISPLSLRKNWQYDDQPYNFILDFLLSFTPQNLEKDLLLLLYQARKEVTKVLDTTEKRLKILESVCGDATKRRLQTSELKNIYLERLKQWEK